MKKLSEYQEKEIIEVYTSGESIMTTSKKLGLSYCVVREFLSDNRITRSNREAQKNAKKHAFSDEDIANIVNLYNPAFFIFVEMDFIKFPKKNIKIITPKKPKLIYKLPIILVPTPISGLSPKTRYEKNLGVVVYWIGIFNNLVNRPDNKGINCIIVKNAGQIWYPLFSK